MSLRCYDITARTHCSFAQHIDINEDSNSSRHSLLHHSTAFMPYRVDLLLCHPTIQENRLLLSAAAVSLSLSPLLHNTIMTLVLH